jgi:hypothetical protein
MKMGAFASGRILKKTSTHQLQILLQTDQSPLYKTMKKEKKVRGRRRKFIPT